MMSMWMDRENWFTHKNFQCKQSPVSQRYTHCLSQSGNANMHTSLMSPTLFPPRFFYIIFWAAFPSATVQLIVRIRVSRAKSSRGTDIIHSVVLGGLHALCFAMATCRESKALVLNRATKAHHNTEYWLTHTLSHIQTELPKYLDRTRTARRKENMNSIYNWLTFHSN